MAKKSKNSKLLVHYTRTMTPENLSRAANYVGEYVLKGLGALGKVFTAPLTGGPLSPATVVLPKTKELLDAERKLRETQEELIGKAMTWVSPLNYGAALATGNGLNARKGEEEVASWAPAWQAVGRLGELYVGPKAVKGVKAAPRVVVNTAAKAGVKPAKAAAVSREIKLATKNAKLDNNSTVIPHEDLFDFWHGGLESDFDFGNLDVLRKASKQSKRNRNYAGFYMYSTPRLLGAFNYGFGEAHGIKLKPDAKKLKVNFNTERIEALELLNYRNQGYDYIEGKDVWGEPEYILLNKDAIQNTGFFDNSLGHNVHLRSRQVPKIDLSMKKIPERTSLAFFQNLSRGSRRGLIDVGDGNIMTPAEFFNVRIRSIPDNLILDKNVEVTPFSDLHTVQDVSYFTPRVKAGIGKFNELYGEETINRLKELGYNTEERIPIVEKGFRNIRFPSSVIRENSRRPVYLGTFDESTSRMGEYHMASDIAIADPTLSKNLPSVMLHERNMHGTDKVIEGLADAGKPKAKNMYQDFLDKLFVRKVEGEHVSWKEPAPGIERVGNNSYVIDYGNGIKYPMAEGTNKWYEGRSTINELKRKYLYDEWKKAGKPATLEEIRPQYLKRIKELSEKELLNDLANETNGYGLAYVALRKNNPTFIPDLKELLKHGSEYIAPIGGYTLYNLFNLPLLKLQYLKQGGKMNKIRKMLTAAGGSIKKRIKRLKDGYRYIPDERNGGWNRISDNEMSDVFATYVVGGKDKRADVRIDKKSENFDRKFKYDETEIPFIKDKEITLTNAGLYAGAKLSTNLLDSIAKYAKASGLPLKTAVGLVAKETSLGNPTVDSSLKKLSGDGFAYQLAKALNGGLHINEGKALNPKDLINFHYEELNPYLGLKNIAYKKSVGNMDDYGREGPFGDEDFLKRYRELLKLGENYSDSLAKKLLSNFNPNKNVLQAGFEFYKLNPRKYNYNQTNYPQLVEERGNMVYNSPEFKSWLSTSEYKKQGGKMNAIEQFKQGSKIHIKKKNRGKFTAYCGGNVNSACIAKAKASGNPTLVKRATFADNARHFKHRLGGNIVEAFKLRRLILNSLNNMIND